jgi:RNA polymerase sigma-70 factor (ECF subfamily)
MPGNLEHLVARIKEDDEEAFKEFFFTFYNDVYKFLYFLSGDGSIAEDLCQEAFIKFWLARKSINPDISPKNYLFKIARNLYLNYKRDTKQTVEVDELSIAGRNTTSDEYETNEIILNLLNELPPRCREIFVLSRYNDLSYKEIAELLNISIQTVKNQINKALAILRVKIKDYL